ncbi:N-acetylglucosamine-1-phosphate uridyltransferase / Glucosamine-1-phosphate N-acetyltransferase [hydrothermal vent metagenome]|uniref:N-acetylglucosamine-1-phosphate uridyltransferase / Glucosamine-1-phosphate N-acetyltransferase n=1 Tax=hydrothermal vent metagenome TaxID=652676 RepID=A0A3B0ZEB1_9ZZZZ
MPFDKDSLNIVILAAGKGTRMKSNLPKVMHPLAGKPLVQHCYDTARDISTGPIQIIYGHGGEFVRESLSDLSVTWVEQVEQLGTGHAVQQAVPNISDEHTVLVLYGDVPLLNAETLTVLVGQVHASSMALLTVSLDDPSGYGRIVRDAHENVKRIVEHKDASDAEKLITEINTGILAVQGRWLKKWLSELESDNSQGEYYLTDIIEMAVNDSVTVTTCAPSTVAEILGVNDKKQLAYLERIYQRQQADRLMEQGVTLHDPARFDVRGTITTGTDVSIDANVIIEGNVVLGDRVTISANCHLKDVIIKDDVIVLPNSVLDDAVIGAACRIGPFARIRPGTVLAENINIGNYVEVKKSDIAKGSKVNHLSYIGDTSIGSNVNIGAGTITCNYDGVNKSRTIIEDDVFVGSDTQLVAPVTVKSGSTIGAGSTITKDTPENELTLSRSKQQTIKGWKRPVKQ